jgi:hypothetical protein
VTVLFASDLDRTLIYPLWTLSEQRRASEPVAEIYQGRPITTCSLETLRLLRHMGSAFVPVTTRSIRQLQRIEPIWEIARRGWAICANGATLLHHGEPDPEWDADVEALCGACATPDEAREALHTALGPADPDGWLLRVRDCDQRFLYAICELEKIPGGTEEAATEAMGPLGWAAILHGRKLYLLPAGLTKLACVERLGASTLLAAGDSMLDASLLVAADVAWVPSDAELVQSGAVPEGARVTRESNLGAAEEIAREALALMLSVNDTKEVGHVGEHVQGPAHLAREAGRR